MFGSIRPFVCLCGFVRATLCACCGVVNIRAQLAECSKITVTYGIQSKISVCLSVIRGHSRSMTLMQRSRAFNFFY